MDENYAKAVAFKERSCMECSSLLYAKTHMLSTVFVGIEDNSFSSAMSFLRVMPGRTKNIKNIK